MLRVEAKKWKVKVQPNEGQVSVEKKKNETY